MTLHSPVCSTFPPFKQTPCEPAVLSSLLSQDSGSHPEELLNPAEYMSYQRVCNIDHFPESQPAPAHPPATFLPQHPYEQQPPSEPTYSNTSLPAPGPRAPFTFPKEQSVWHATSNCWLGERQHANKHLMVSEAPVKRMCISSHLNSICSKSLKSVKNYIFPAVNSPVCCAPPAPLRPPVETCSPCDVRVANTNCPPHNLHPSRVPTHPVRFWLFSHLLDILVCQLSKPCTEYTIVSLKMHFSILIFYISHSGSDL